jgi:hypothetical protein
LEADSPIRSIDLIGSGSSASGEAFQAACQPLDVARERAMPRFRHDQAKVSRP